MENGPQTQYINVAYTLYNYVTWWSSSRMGHLKTAIFILSCLLAEIMTQL